jgi:hypothetical protein
MNSIYFREYYAKHRDARLKRAKERTEKLTTAQRAARKEYMRQYRLRNLDKWKRTPAQQAKINARKREIYATDEGERNKIKRKVREWWHANPEKRKAQRLREFGLSLEDYQVILERQGGACAICGHSDLTNPLFFPVVDHCHRTNLVRGLLCANCNHLLGKAKDSPERLRRAADYLETNGLCGAASTQNSER